ncbi:hypothetical protein THAOC_32867, partial [Thalassiosira oceanica]
MDNTNHGPRGSRSLHIRGGIRRSREQRERDMRALHDQPQGGSDVNVTNDASSVSLGRSYEFHIGGEVKRGTIVREDKDGFVFAYSLNEVTTLDAGVESSVMVVTGITKNSIVEGSEEEYPKITIESLTNGLLAAKGQGLYGVVSYYNSVYHCVIRGAKGGSAEISYYNGQGTSAEQKTYKIPLDKLRYVDNPLLVMQVLDDGNKRPAAGDRPSLSREQQRS